MTDLPPCFLCPPLVVLSPTRLLRDYPSDPVAPSVLHAHLSTGPSPTPVCCCQYSGKAFPTSPGGRPYGGLLSAAEGSLCVSLLTSLSVCAFLCLSLSLSLSLYSSLSFCLCLSVCLSLSVSLSVSLSLCISLFVLLFLSLFLSSDVSPCVSLFLVLSLSLSLSVQFSSECFIGMTVRVEQYCQSSPY